MPHAKKVSRAAGFRLDIDSKKDYISELTSLNQSLLLAN